MADGTQHGYNDEDVPGPDSYKEDPLYIAVNIGLLAALGRKWISYDEYRSLRQRIQTDSNNDSLEDQIGILGGGTNEGYAAFLVEGSIDARAPFRTRARAELDLEQSNKARANRIADAWDRAYSGIERRLRDIAEDRTLDTLTHVQANATLQKFLSGPVQEKLWNSFVDFVEVEEAAEQADPEAFIFGGTPILFRIETTAAANWLKRNIGEVLAATRPDLEPGTFDEIKVRGDMIEGLIPILAREGVRQDAMDDLSIILFDASSGILSGLLGNTLDARYSEGQIDAFDVVYKAFNQLFIGNLFKKFADARLRNPMITPKEFVSPLLADVAQRALQNAKKTEQANAITGVDIIADLATLGEFKTGAEQEDDIRRAAAKRFLDALYLELPEDEKISFENAFGDMEDSFVESGETDPGAFFKEDPAGSFYIDAAEAARVATDIVANRRTTWITEGTAIKKDLSPEGKLAFDDAEPDLYDVYTSDTTLTAREVLSDFVELAEETVDKADIAAVRPAEFDKAFEEMFAEVPEGLRIPFGELELTFKDAFEKSDSDNATDFLETHPDAKRFVLAIAEAKAEAERDVVRDAELQLVLEEVLADLPEDQRIPFKNSWEAIGEAFDASDSTDPKGFIRTDPTARPFVLASETAAQERGAEQARLVQQQDLGKPAGQAIATEISRLQSRIDSGDFSPEETALAQQRLNLLTRFGDAAAGQFGAEAAAGDTQTREEFLAGAFPTPKFAPDPVGGPEGAAAREEAGVAPLDFSRRDIFTPGDITTVDRNIEAQFLGAEADAARQFAGLERDPVTGRPNFGSIKGLEGYFPSMDDFNRNVQVRAAADARRLNQPTDNIDSVIMNQAIAQELAFIRGEGTIDRPGDVGATEAVAAAGRARSVTPPRPPPARVVK